MLLISLERIHGERNKHEVSITYISNLKKTIKVKCVLPPPFYEILNLSLLSLISEMIDCSS